MATSLPRITAVSCVPSRVVPVSQACCVIPQHTSVIVLHLHVYQAQAVARSPMRVAQALIAVRALELTRSVWTMRVFASPKAVETGTPSAAPFQAVDKPLIVVHATALTPAQTIHAFAKVKPMQCYA